MRSLASRTLPVSTAVVIILIMFLPPIVNITFQDAFANQCARFSPDRNYERSDVIFVGKVTNIMEASPLDLGTIVTFDVLKAWKGVDTQKVTIHNGGCSSCGSYPLREDDPERGYLVYATKDLSGIRVTFCGGTAPLGTLNADSDLKYLDDNFVPIEFRTGHTMSVNIFPPLQILGSFAAIAAAAFILIRRA